MEVKLQHNLKRKLASGPIIYCFWFGDGIREVAAVHFEESRIEIYNDLHEWELDEQGSDGLK